MPQIMNMYGSELYVCINLFEVGQIYMYVNKKHLALQ